MVTGIITALKNDSTVAGLVGDSKMNVPKIYPVFSPQREKFPFIVVRQKSGVLIGKDCNYEGSCDVQVWIDTYDGIGEVVDAVISVLASLNNEVVNSATLVNVTDSNDFKANGEGLYAKTLSYNCIYTGH